MYKTSFQVWGFPLYRLNGLYEDTLCITFQTSVDQKCICQLFSNFKHNYPKKFNRSSYYVPTFSSVMDRGPASFAKSMMGVPIPEEVVVIKHRDSHYKVKMVMRPSYLYYGNSYTSKTTFYIEMVSCLLSRPESETVKKTFKTHNQCQFLYPYLWFYLIYLFFFTENFPSVMMVMQSPNPYDYSNTPSGGDLWRFVVPHLLYLARSLDSILASFVLTFSCCFHHDDAVIQICLTANLGDHFYLLSQVMWEWAQPMRESIAYVLSSLIGWEAYRMAWDSR